MNNQWAHIWGGAVDIEIIGQEPERFLNLALARNLDISGVRRDSTGRLYLRLALGDMGYLRELSRLSHCRFRICRRYGLPFLLRFIRHRPMLPVAGFCCLFLLIWLSSLVWGIEIVGPYPISPERQQRLLSLSEQAGVSLYASRWGMDLEAAENYLLREEKALVFAEIEPHGSRLVVSAVYRVDVTEPDQQKEPGDVVAVADGVIRQILVQQGRALVKPGTAVRQGEVLISGQVGKLQMAAAGLITADIWAEGYGECPRTISGIKETGANVSGIGIRLSDGPVLTIWGESRSPYALFQRKEQVASVFLWRKMALPVEIIISQYNEQTAFTEHLSVETAYRRAEAAAMAAALVLLPEQAAIAETHAEDISLDQQLLRVHVRLRACYDLGRFQQGIDAEAAERGARQAAEQAVL